MITMTRLGWRTWVLSVDFDGKTFMAWGSRRSCIRAFDKWAKGRLRLINP